MNVGTKKEKLTSMIGAVMIFMFIAAVQYAIPGEMRTDAQAEAYAMKMADQEAEIYFKEKAGE